MQGLLDDDADIVGGATELLDAPGFLGGYRPHHVGRKYRQTPHLLLLPQLEISTRTTTTTTAIMTTVLNPRTDRHATRTTSMVKQKTQVINYRRLKPTGFGDWWLA